MSAWTSWFDHTLNGLIIGNVYALMAVGLALIFGVANLINFAHGSVYTVGAFIGWSAVTYLGTPLPVTMGLVLLGSAVLGLLIERLGLRPLAGSVRIAPLLATIGISFVLDQCVQLWVGPDPRALPNPLPAWRFQLGSGTIGALDLLIAGIGLVSAALLYGFLRFTRLGWAVRATAQDREAALQMGVDIHAVNQAVFAIASALGGLSGLLVGMYYNHISPAMSFQATLKGVVAVVIGGVGHVPGAIVGSLLLGLTESWGVALFGTPYRNLIAFLLLVAVLIWKPEGLFGRRKSLPPEPLTGTFVAPSRPVQVPRWAWLGVIALLVLLPWLLQPWEQGSYVLITLSNAWLYALLGLSLTLVAGTTGQISLGHAGLLTLGAYASALLALHFHWPAALTIVLAGLFTSVLGTALVLPALRLRGHYVSIATLGLGEIVALVVLNWESVTRGPIGVSGIPPLSWGDQPLDGGPGFYWLTLAAVLLLAGLQSRLLRTHLGRAFRAVREDEVAARSYGVSPNRYKALAFAFGGFAAGVAGATSAHLFSYINHETFTSQISVLALTIVILGGMGNVPGAVLGAALLVGLPELFRVAVEYRVLIYGVTLLLLVRFRPQGLLGTV